ncbi:MAG: cyclic 2,3-diphosphoglycerate synthase [Candidatus Woesearchaeota archaeon]
MYFMKKKRVLIMGAAGRDFHNFNVLYKEDANYEVVAFTATQIPDIEGRLYPGELAGPLYPQGIPIYPEDELEKIIKENNIDEVMFAYSDVSNDYVMERAAKVNAAGASFRLAGAKETMLKSSKPLIAVCATRTGCGKSQTTRKVIEALKGMGKKVVTIRHPMPYGDLARQKVQRFETLEDLVKHECTIEEIEEYEPHIMNDTVVYAGVDYEAILREAEKEADVIVWDGGNNDPSFYQADLYITVADPHRVGHERKYYPGQANVHLADVVVINKEDSAEPRDITELYFSIKQMNKKAKIVDANSKITVDNEVMLKGKRALVIEDGPTLTHGGMKFGAGVIAAQKYGCELVDPRPYAVGKIKETFEKYPGIGTLLPAMGYGKEQMKDLETTIKNTDCDVVIIGTPINLKRIISINKPSVRVKYELEEIGKTSLADIIKEKFS